MTSNAVRHVDGNTNKHTFNPFFLCLGYIKDQSKIYNIISMER